MSLMIRKQSSAAMLSFAASMLIVLVVYVDTRLGGWNAESVLFSWGRDEHSRRDKETGQSIDDAIGPPLTSVE